MALAAALILIFIVCVAFLWNEGMWSNTLTLMNVLLAALVATNYFEPAADLLDKNLPAYTYMLDFLAIWGIFVIAFSILRAATDQLSTTQVKFKLPIEQAGRALTAAAVGVCMICFTLVTLHTAPLARTAFKGSFQAEPLSNNFLGMAPDRLWLGYVKHVSKTGLAGSEFDPQNEFIVKYGARRHMFSKQEGLAVKR